MELFIIFIIFIFLSIVSFYVVVHIIKIWTGCNDKEAVAKLQRFINGKPLYKFEDDIGLQNDIWDNVRKIIGEKRVQQLVNLNSTMITNPLLFFGEEGALPFIAVSLYYLDDNEKKVLENIILNVIKQYLLVYKYDISVLAVWKERYDLNMPILQIRYARNGEEKRVLEIAIRNQQQNITTSNSFPKDDTEDDDLDE